MFLVVNSNWNRELLPTSGIRAGLSAITPAAFLPIPGILLASPLPDCSISLPVESHANYFMIEFVCWGNPNELSVLVIILRGVTWGATSHITVSLCMLWRYSPYCVVKHSLYCVLKTVKIFSTSRRSWPSIFTLNLFVKESMHLLFKLGTIHMLPVASHVERLLRLVKSQNLLERR